MLPSSANTNARRPSAAGGPTSFPAAVLRLAVTARGPTPHAQYDQGGMMHHWRFHYGVAVVGANPPTGTASSRDRVPSIGMQRSTLRGRDEFLSADVVARIGEWLSTEERDTWAEAHFFFGAALSKLTVPRIDPVSEIKTWAAMGVAVHYSSSEVRVPGALATAVVEYDQDGLAPRQVFATLLAFNPSFMTTRNEFQYVTPATRIVHSSTQLETGVAKKKKDKTGKRRG